MSQSKFCVCPKCWQLYAFYEIHNWGDSLCRKCGKGNCVEAATPNIPSPILDAEMLCLVCAYYKPWGIFDPTTGVTVCKDCRDKARKPPLRQPTKREIAWLDANCEHLGIDKYSVIRDSPNNE